MPFGGFYSAVLLIGSNHRLKLDRITPEKNQHPFLAHLGQRPNYLAYQNPNRDTPEKLITEELSSEKKRK